MDNRFKPSFLKITLWHRQFIPADDWPPFICNIFFVYGLAITFYHYGFAWITLLYLGFVIWASWAIIDTFKKSKTKLCRKCNKPMNRLQDYGWHRKGGPVGSGNPDYILQCDTCKKKIVFR